MAFGLPNLGNALDSLLGRFGLPSELPIDPMPILASWFDEAVAAKATPNPDAFTLATSTPDGRPSARIVLCKSIDVRRGAIVFYSHRTGRKGRELEANPHAAAVFHFDHQGRQARVEGAVSLLSDEASDAYFARRSVLARVGAWASHQSEPIANRRVLLDAVREAAKRFGVGIAELLESSSDRPIPRPPYWGGFALHAARVELWIGGDGRLHDRAVWNRTIGPASEALSQGSEAGPWTSTRLFP